MSTIFATIPESFEGPAAQRQRNAIRSWWLMRPQPRIIFLGIDDDSVVDFARMNYIEAAGIERSPEGIPLVNSALKTVTNMRDDCEDVVCFVNADGVYLDLNPALELVKREFCEFLMIGRRWDIMFEDRVMDFRAGWEDRLRSYVLSHGSLHGKRAMDYLIFRGNFLHHDMPDFAVGRTAYDNWCVWKATQEEIPIIDATCDVFLVHQDHPHTRAVKRRESVTQQNRELLWAVTDKPWGIDDATHYLQCGRVKECGRKCF